MRSLTYFIATTLDGFIATSEGGDPSAPGGIFEVTGDYVQHVVSEYPEILPGPAREAMGITAEGSRFDAAVMGRATYEIGLKQGIASPYSHLRQQVVFSRSIAESPDPAIELVSTDPVARMRELKAEAGKGIWLVGGASLAGQLYDEIDELIIKLNPVSIRTGIPLFTGTFQPTRFELTAHTILEGGVAFLTYSKSAS